MSVTARAHLTPGLDRDLVDALRWTGGLGECCRHLGLRCVAFSDRHITCTRTYRTIENGIAKLSGAADLGRTGGSGQFRWQGEVPAIEDQKNDLERFFWAHDGPVVHKWLHYFEIYDRHFARFRNTPVRFLEIGVSKGGSLDMWRSYFGEDAVIFGIDIDPACAAFDGLSGSVRIGSQADAGFVTSVVEEMGGVDIVLDDGSHDSLHIRASLDALFPKLSDGGVYMVEDLQAAYWPGFTGGYRRPASFMSVVKTLIDDLHHWYHPKGQRIAATANALDSIHVYDSITVLEKRRQKPPENAQRGAGRR